MKRRIFTSLMLCLVLLMSCFSFLGCSNTEAYSLSQDGTYYTFVGAEGFEETEYTILSEIKGIPVTEIAENAFSENTTLTKVVIPDSITKMGKGAFYKCGALSEVTIGAGLKNISDSAFEQCSKLATVNFSEGLEKINRNAFSKCLKLNNITFPDTVTTLCEKAFYACRGLTSITLPSNLTKIEISCFEDCSGATEVTINKTLKEISTDCFRKCSKLKKINFAMDGELELIGGSAFLGSAVTELTFPDSLKGIKAGAFFNCKALRTVTFGKSIEFIGGSTSKTEGGAFSLEVRGNEAHIEKMIFPDEALGYGWYPSHDGWGSAGERQPWVPSWPDGTIHDASPSLYFITVEEMQSNNGAKPCKLFALSMGGYSWFKAKTPESN